MYLFHPPRAVSVRVRDQPVASDEFDLGKQAAKFGISARGIVVKDADAVACAHRLNLADHAGTLIAAQRYSFEISRVIERRTINEIADLADEQVARQIVLRLDRRRPVEILLRGIDAEGVIRQLC